MTSLRVGAGLDEVLAVAGGAVREVADGCLAPDAQAWFASPEQGLSAAIESAAGAGATRAALTALAPSSLEVAASVASDNACWAEVVRRGDGGAETCIVGLTSGPAGEISRLVWLRGPIVPARVLDVPDPAPNARPILERYFGDLMSSDFHAAAAHFTADTIYSHPPYAGGTERVLFEGREALRRGFEVERGPSPARQIITGLWQRGDRVFVEGVIEGIPNGGTFFSTAQITAGGEITRYVAFYSATRIPG
jgi:hypothetical protein